MPISTHFFIYVLKLLFIIYYYYKRKFFCWYQLNLIFYFLISFLHTYNFWSCISLQNWEFLQVITSLIYHRVYHHKTRTSVKWQQLWFIIKYVIKNLRLSASDKSDSQASIHEPFFKWKKTTVSITMLWIGLTLSV